MKGATMRCFIATITDTITTVFGTRRRGTVVTVAKKHKQSLVLIARALLVLLTGQTSVYLRAANLRRERIADLDAGAARTLDHHCLSMSWPRRSWRPVGCASGAYSARF